MFNLSQICMQYGISKEIANKILFLAFPFPEGIWAKEVLFENNRYVVGQGIDHKYFSVFKCPCEGHCEEWELIKPINSAQDLKVQLGG